MPYEPVSVARALFSLLSRNPQLLYQFHLMRLRQEWSSLPAPFPDGTAPLEYDGATLTVAVRNHVWRQELTLRGRELETAVRAAWPELPLARLRFQVHDLPAPPAPPTPPADPALRLRAIHRTTPGSPGEQEFRRLHDEWKDSEEPFARSLLRMLESRLPEEE
jgi:hypothetical protein